MPQQNRKMRLCRYKTKEWSTAKCARHKVNQSIRLIQSPSLYNVIYADFEGDFYKIFPKFWESNLKISHE